MERCELPQEIIDYVTECTLIRARQAVRRVRNLGDVKDVQQDLLLDVLQRLPNFDGERADIKTFISRLVDNKVASMIDTFRRARRRGEGVGPSVDDWVLDEDGAWARRYSVMDAELLRAHLGIGGGRGFEDMVNLRVDVTAVVMTLPPELRALCVLLRTRGPWELIQQGEKASAVLYKQIAEIRDAFVEAQLHLYQIEF